MAIHTMNIAIVRRSRYHLRLGIGAFEFYRAFSFSPLFAFFLSIHSLCVQAGLIVGGVSRRSHGVSIARAMRHL